MRLKGACHLKDSPPLRIVIMRLKSGELLALACSCRPDRCWRKCSKTRARKKPWKSCCLTVLTVLNWLCNPQKAVSHARSQCCKHSIRAHNLKPNDPKTQADSCFQQGSLVLWTIITVYSDSPISQFKKRPAKSGRMESAIFLWHRANYFC